MDYCHPCRRHLNGALACPGCGAPVEELRASDPYLAVSEERPPRVSDETDGADEAGAPTGEVPGDASRGGRGSRRDRKAAAHRRRRRRTLLITAGFVLAAGGLSLAELGMDAPGSPAKPAAAGGETTDGGATREVGESSAAPVDETSRTTSASGTPSPDASASATVSASTSESPDAERSKTAEEAGVPSAPQASAPGTAPTPDPPSTGTGDPPPPPPPTTTPAPTTSPDPTPTETCDRFLWWCT